MMKKLRPLFRLAMAGLMLCLPGLLSAQTTLSDEARAADAASLRRVMEKYEYYTKTTPHEKVYLHLDKPYYTKGDTIWYKAYMLFADSFHPDTLNLTLYVDVVQPDGRILAEQRIRVIDGIGHGQFVFPDALTPGFYMIRAYTSWMRNFTDEPLFSRLIPVYGQEVTDASYHWNTSYRISSGPQEDTLKMTLFLTDNRYVSKADEPFRFDFRARGLHAVQGEPTTDADGTYRLNLTLPKRLKKATGNLSLTVGEGKSREKLTMAVPLLRTDSIGVRFFPEGGHLVTGVCSRVAFQVLDGGGTGVPATGAVFTSDGRVVQTFTADGKGVGAFYLTPKAGQRYYAEVEADFGDGLRLDARADLPEALPKGYVLEVFNLNGRDVQVCIKRKGIADEELLGLTVRSGGRLAFAKMLPVKQDSLMFTLPRQDFPSGVSQITLFGVAGQPLAERLVFVNNYKPLKINISAPQDVYKPRELVKMDISVTDADGRPVEADLSLAVTDIAQVIDTSRFEMNILTQMLLQSDLRGRITDPGYSVGDSTMASRKALEMLMLTQGWRRYDLSGALDEATPDYPWRFEWGLKIRGVVRHMTLNYPLPDHQVTRMMGTVKKDAFTDSRWKHEVRGWDYKLPTGEGTAAQEKSDGFQLAEIDQAVTDENGEFQFYTGLEGQYMMVLQTKKGSDSSRSSRRNSEAAVVERRIELYDMTDSLPTVPFMQQLDMRPDEKAAYLAALRAQEAVEADIDVEDRELRILRDSLTTYIIPAVEVVEPLLVAKNMAREMSSYQVDAEVAALMLANLDNSTHIPTLYEILQYMYPNKMYIVENFDEDGNSTGNTYTWLGRPILTLDLTPKLPRDFDKNAGMSYRSIESIYVVDSENPIPEIYQRLKNYSEYWDDLYDLQSAEVFGAVVVMYTRTETKQPVSGIRRTLWEGYAAPVEFYSPDYATYNPDDPFDVAAHEYDRRSTLYWNPSVRTDAEGKASVSFYNSDRYTRLRTRIEGITADGRLGTMRR